MATRDVDLGVIHAVSVKRIRITFKKDGEYWTGIDSASLTFEAPDRSTTFERSMTLDSDSIGRWYYDTVVTDFASADAGYWTIKVKVVDGTITDYWPHEIGFELSVQP